MSLVEKNDSFNFVKVILIFVIFRYFALDFQILSISLVLGVTLEKKNYK